VAPEPGGSPPCHLVLAPGARRALTDTLPAGSAFAAWEFINGPLLRQPRVVGVVLRRPFEGLWRARRGQYRVRYRIDDALGQILVLDIGPRQEAHFS
jgi:mRNA interferase RelE/StbE